MRVTETRTSGETEVTEPPVSVRVKHVDIRFRVYEDQIFSARQLMVQRFRSRASTEVHAVKDVSFETRVGEALGIIGPNGSGKSSLLRAIAGLQSITNGVIEVRGQTALLGVGAALKLRLSGYRNVMLGGLAMGMTRAEVEAEMENVVEFSGLREAMSRPMNTYSSGMRARLAFSIATLRVPDILLVDEALAVGDREFRARSLERLEEIRAAAGTILMVSHSLREITNSCDRVIWLEDGELRAEGEPDEVVSAYEQSG